MPNDLLKLRAGADTGHTVPRLSAQRNAEPRPRATAALLLLLPLLTFSTARAADIERIWLTYRTPSDQALTVNWESKEPGNTWVEYWTDERVHIRDATNENVTLHHLDIPLPDPDTLFHYRVQTDEQKSDVHTFRSLPRDELRVAVIADTGYVVRPWAPGVLAAQPHLLISAGDHIPALHRGKPVPPETTAAFSTFVDAAPELFRSTPWLPLLGNHDRELRPRGAQRPVEPVYDVEATAFRKFFGLPADGWRWHFDVPRFGARFVAADLSHLQDQGTTWQTNHPFARGTPQFTWFEKVMTTSQQPFVVTLYNEKNSTVRGLENGEWGRLIQRGSLAVTGFGYFAERAEVDGFPYLNTAVKGDGDKYRDPKAVAFFSEDNFVLLTFRREPLKLRAELRAMDGRVLDTREIDPRPTAAAVRTP